MIKKNIYIVGQFSDQNRWDDLISRLTWYLTPYLDQIDRVEICATTAEIAAARLAGPLDPLIADHMPRLKEQLVSVTPTDIRAQLNRVDPGKHLFLLADDSLEKDYKVEIGRFHPKGRFYKVDPVKTRMEGSFYLWAGHNTFTDTKAETAAYHARFKEMHADIGQHQKAYVFGTGPSLGEFVDSHDFSDGLTIISNSIVKNHDLLDRLKPRIIVAGDPIFHAGCSTYATAFRTALVSALEITSAWFICPLRDVKIYATYLPEKFQSRIIGIPFDANAPPPTDLAQQFALKPYPNILTLMLLPLAATFAKSIHIAGCDGRRITEDSAFWTHDKKSQFVDEMRNIKKVHPGFFAIDYNNYYLDHARDLEVVLLALEAAGKICVNECRSFLPALNVRDRVKNEAPSQPYYPKTIAILDPDAKGDWGHFLAYDRRLGIAVADKGFDFAVIGRQDLPQEAQPESARTLANVFSVHSWSVGNKWPDVDTRHLSSFAFELDKALVQLEREQPNSDILIFMYCGSVEVVEILEHILIPHPRVQAVINLFWSYSFDITNPAYMDRWSPVLQRVLFKPGQVKVMHSTPQIAAEFNQALGFDIPVLPHPSTTFSDTQAQELALKPKKLAPTNRKLRILFPGGPRSEKGYLLSTAACASLAQSGEYELLMRTRIDASTEPRLRRAVEALDSEKINLFDGDFPQDAFNDWLASADVIVIPYLPEAFSNRTSGMLVDAMLLGVPVVVINDTWLADELARSKAGLSVAATSEGLTDGIRTVLADYDSYAAATRAAAAEYVKQSSWSVLVERVLKVVPVGLPPLSLGSTFNLYLFSNALEAPNPETDMATALKAVKKNATGILTYDNPVSVMAAALGRGQKAEDVLDIWATQAEAHLALYRKVRQKIHVVERNQTPVARERFPDMILPEALMAPLTTDDPLLYALASACFDQHPSAQQLLAELRASGPPPQNGYVGPDLLAAMARYHQLSPGYRDSLQTQEKVQSEHKKLQIQAGDATQESARLLQEQVVQLQATTEAYYRDSEELRQEISRIYASKSWRVTRPLRSLRQTVWARRTPDQ